MANIQYYDVIIRPVITEKTMNQISEKKIHLLCSYGCQQGDDQGSR